MKKIITVVIMMAMYHLPFAQTLPNPEFQTWVSEGAYENPESWSTSNDPTLAMMGLIPVSKSSDAYVGSFSARLETQDLSIFGVHIPGIVTLAQINIITSPPSYSISGGFALQENVSKLTGMYKYDGVENDSATVLIYNFKHDVGSDFDTIGYGVTYLSDASEWTEFTVYMQNLNNHVPDTFNVIIISSSSPDFTTGAGSVLLVDELKIETNTGIINISNNRIDVSVYPNPSSNFVQFETSGIEKDRLVSIFDITGKLISISNFSNTKTLIDVKKLNSGIYTYRISNQNSILNSGSFIKN